MYLRTVDKGVTIVDSYFIFKVLHLQLRFVRISYRKEIIMVLLAILVLVLFILVNVIRTNNSIEVAFSSVELPS